MTDTLDITRLDPADAAATRECVAVFEAVYSADFPDLAFLSARVLRVWFHYGFMGDPAETWLLRAAGTGDVVGLYRLELPDLENQAWASLHIVVPPGHRRRGLGRALLRHAAQRAAAAGRATLGGEVRDGSAGDAFAAWAGTTPGIGGAVRHLDLRKLPDGKFAGLRAEAARAAAGYSLVTWTGSTPERYLGQLAEVMNAYADAPHDAGIETGTLDAERLRDRAEATGEAMGGRRYVVAAVHDETGNLAAMTQLMVDPDIPQWGHQGLTAVARTHRGHRLGLLVKLAMIDWIAEAEPAVERIETGNASANAHMIAVNDALGFEVIEPAFHNVELAVAKAPGQS
jgi:RimJ/RimL family protein N-acetyltransferase